MVAAVDGYVIGETTSLLSNGVYDAGLVKTDLQGNLVWEKAYGGTGSDVLNSVIGVKDGYVIAGYTNSFGSGSRDVYLVKTDLNGNLVWQKTYGGTGVDGGHSVVAIADGYVIAGYTGSFGNGAVDVYLVRTDLNGNLVWQKTYGGTENDQVSSLVAVNDGYLIAGYTNSFGNGSEDVYLVRTDLNGNLVWQKTYGGTGHDYGSSLAAVRDGFIIVGSTDSFGNKSGDVYLVKTDFNGNLLWQKTFGGRGYYHGNDFLVVDDGFVITGSTAPFENGSEDVYLIKTDFAGNLVWDGTYGGAGNEQGNAIIAVNDGYIIAGSSYINGSYHVYLARVNNAARSIDFSIRQEGAQPVRAGVGTVQGSDRPGAEKVLPPIAAVTLGAGIGFIGLYLEKLFNFIFEGVKEYLKEYFSDLEIRYRRIRASTKKPVVLGLSVAEIVIGIGSAILFGLAFLVAGRSPFLFENIVLFVFMAGLTLLVHEIAHISVAFRHGIDTEYKFWALGTFTMFLTSLAFGTVFAQPARTIIDDQEFRNAPLTAPVAQIYIDEFQTRARNKIGQIAVAGPAASLALAIVFLIVFINGVFTSVALMGLSMNLLLCIYSLMPFKPMEGLKVRSWNKWLWGLLFIVPLISYLALMTIVEV